MLKYRTQNSFIFGTNTFFKRTNQHTDTTKTNKNDTPLCVRILFIAMYCVCACTFEEECAKCSFIIQPVKACMGTVGGGG